MIAKGVSYVTADLLGSDRILPWWMVSDAHGTLYIARVGKGRKYIDTASATKVSAHLVDFFLSLLYCACKPFSFQRCSRDTNT